VLLTVPVHDFKFPGATPSSSEEVVFLLELLDTPCATSRVASVSLRDRTKEGYNPLPFRRLSFMKTQTVQQVSFAPYIKRTEV
jgi:hypothetical protein